MFKYLDEIGKNQKKSSWSFGQGHLVIFDLGTWLFAHYI